MIPQLLPSGWENGAPRGTSSSNPSCLSNCAPQALNPRPNTVSSGTAKARAGCSSSSENPHWPKCSWAFLSNHWDDSFRLRFSPGAPHLQPLLRSPRSISRETRPKDVRHAEISRRLKPRHRGSEEISGAGVGKRSRRRTGPSWGFSIWAQGLSVPISSPPKQESPDGTPKCS